MPGFPALERPLRYALFAGIALVLLTPFVVTTGTLYPFVVGKALWTRSIIEVTFALWAVLALVNPRYRPPRSRVLGLLAAGFAVSLLAAVLGASPMRSFWSSYERMQGVLDAAHWLAFAVVLVSTLRGRAEWRALLAGVAGTGAALALLVVAVANGVAVPFYGLLPELDPPRVGGPLGNPIFLSGYMVVSLLLALGLGARAWLAARDAGAEAAAAARQAVEERRAAAARAAGTKSRKARQRRARTAPGGNLPRPASGAAALRAQAGLWIAAAALALWTLALAGSVGGFVGLFASLGFLALGAVVLARGRARTIAATVLAALAAVTVVAGLRATTADRTAQYLPENPVARYVLSTHVTRPGVQSRLAAWKAGLDGFAARPALGWGPENFIAVFGRHGSGYAAFAEPHDQAHGKLVEVAATTGAAGIAAWLALWSVALVAVWRAARGMEAGERALALCAAAAAAGHLAQAQFLFDTSTATMQATVLIAFAAGLEPLAFAGPRRGLPAALRRRASALLEPKAVRAVLAAAALTAAVAGLWVNRSIRAAAAVEHLPSESRTLESLRPGIDLFPPLANIYRRTLLTQMTTNWTNFLGQDEAAAHLYMDWAAGEAAEAVRSDPAEWRAHFGAAQMFAEAARTHPRYADQAERYLAMARELAPHREVFPRPLEPPHSLDGERREDGRYVLRWQWPEGAGYIALAESGGGTPRRHILHAYDPARTSFVLPPGREPGERVYRIKACWYPGQCSAEVAWPAANREGRR